MHTYIYTHICMYIYTHTHIYIHTYIHTHTEDMKTNDEILISW